MTRSLSDGLARVTVSTPTRRLDLALPEDVPVADLMVALIRNSEEGLADDGQRHGGWVLRRSDGGLVDADRSLGAQRIRDGEILRLVPARDEWPEVDYDDVVDAIATGARKNSRSWSPSATQTVGIAVSAVAALVALVSLISAGSQWTIPAMFAIGLSIVFMSTAFVLSRAIGDARGALVLGLSSVALATAGGLFVLGGSLRFGSFTPSQYLLGFAALLISSTIGFAVVGNRTQYFAAGVFVGLLGIIGALFARAESIDGAEAAAITAALTVVLTPLFPILSIRIGKLPMPSLPQTTDELLADPPQLPIERVHATVRRTDEILTGLLIGTMVVVSGCAIMMTASARRSAIMLTVAIGLALLLRARLFPGLRHRVPLIAAGLVSTFTVLAGLALSDRSTALYVIVPLMLMIALGALALGNYFKDRRPTPSIGRMADILDVLLILSIVPLMCVAVGLVTYVRGLYG